MVAPQVDGLNSLGRLKTKFGRLDFSRNRLPLMLWIGWQAAIEWPLDHNLILMIAAAARICGWCLLIVLAAGCALRTPVPPVPVASSADQAAHPLPFKGRLASGNPSELPPAVAMSLLADSPIKFQYREELSHDEYHIPLYISALDPVTYFGSPLGDYGVMAFASLAIIGANGKVLAEYTRRAYVSKSYNLYAEPTHRELEQAARAAVRAKIDQSLYDDSARVAGLLATDGAYSANATE